MQARDPLQFMLEITGQRGAELDKIPGPAEFEIEDVNDAALHTLNAVSEAKWPNSSEPLESLLDLPGKPDYLIEDFVRVRDALLEMPDEVLAFLCKRKGWNVGQ